MTLSQQFGRAHLLCAFVLLSQLASGAAERNPAQFKNAPKIEDAVKRVILLTLKSPRFLYLGLQEEKPDDFAVTERLAYGLWDSLPDAELRREAGKNALHTRELIANQTRRMMADGRKRAKMQAFFHHWLQMDRVENLSKDDKLFPGFTPAIIGDLRTSLNIFVENTSLRTCQFRVCHRLMF